MNETPPRHYYQLQVRDVELLVALYRHGFLLRDHVHTLCFPTCARRRVTRRLHKLVSAGVIIGEPLPLGAFPLGPQSIAPHPGQFAYRLSRNGVDIVAQAQEIDVALVKRRTQAVPSYIGHAVAVASIAASFHAFAVEQGYQVGEFLCAGEARYCYEWIPPSEAKWKPEELRPDGLLHLQRGDDSFSIHVEADMATQGRCELQSKLEAYALYVRTGALKKRLSQSTLHLAIVTTSPERVEVIQRVLSGLKSPQLAETRITTFTELIQQGPLAPIWRSHSPSPLKGLLPCFV